ncbi:MAG: glycosyltransferase family 4 protein [Syntrophales bacterium]
MSIKNVIGGAERVLYEQSTRLSNKGHLVHILTRRLPEHGSEMEIISGVEEWRYDIDHANSFSFFRTTLSNGTKLFELLNHRNTYEVINFHQPFSSFPVIRSRQAGKLKKIYTCHSLSFEEYLARNPASGNFPQNIRRTLNVLARRHIESVVLRKSDIIVVLSRFTKDKVKKTYGIPGSKIKIIPGGVDIEKFHPAYDVNQIRRSLGIPSDRIILLSVRNLVPRMGLENLITAVKDVSLAIPEIYLVLGGKGPLLKDLAMLAEQLNISDRIHFAGFIPEDALPDYYRMADIFVLPTRELEGFGLVTLEALASGVPVLGTPVGGTLEILGGFNPGYLFKDTKPESISDLIIETCRKIRRYPDFKLVTGAKCRSYVEENYSWENNISQLEKIFGAV